MQEWWQMERIARLEVGEALGDLECHIQEFRKESHLLSLKKEPHLRDSSVLVVACLLCHCGPAY